MKFKDLYPEGGKPQRLYCDVCKKYLVLIYECFDDIIEDIHVKIEELPYLFCKKCNKKYLPDRSRFAIIHVYEQAQKNNEREVVVKRRKSGEKFSYGEVEFIHDSDDYYYLPGLYREFDKGFLNPVFFNKTVLIKFDNCPGYKIRLSSKTYGNIIKDETYYIPFGINQSQKIVMWLGDIARLPKEEQYYLRSENINSDHDIGSEFYDAQIECEFTELSLEDELIKSRSLMLENFSKYFGEKIFSLEVEILDLIETLKSPITYSDKEMKITFDLLNKICIEANDNSSLGKILAKLGIESKNLGSLKRLQKIFEFAFSNEKIAEIMTPFFVLYDLRIGFLHLQPNEKIEGIVSSAKERLGIEKDDNYEIIYKTILQRLIDSYKKLDKLLAAKNQ